MYGEVFGGGVCVGGNMVCWGVYTWGFGGCIVGCEGSCWGVAAPAGAGCLCLAQALPLCCAQPWPVLQAGAPRGARAAPTLAQRQEKLRALELAALAAPCRAVPGLCGGAGAKAPLHFHRSPGTCGERAMKAAGSSARSFAPVGRECRPLLHEAPAPVPPRCLRHGPGRLCFAMTQGRDLALRTSMGRRGGSWNGLQELGGPSMGTQGQGWTPLHL